MDPMDTTQDQKIKYGIIFEEGEGYLFCDKLGSGGQGSAAVVRKLHPQNADDVVYVRKKTVPYNIEDEIIDQDAAARWTEVHGWRGHPYIPRLVSWVEYQTLQHDEDPEIINNTRQTSMIFEYCNGLDVGAWVYFFHQRVRRPAPPEFLIKMIHNTFEAIGFLHHGGEQGFLGHCDLIENNMFTHFPDDEINVPNFLIGDLGYVKYLKTHPRITPGNVRWTDWRTIVGDISALYCAIVSVITGQHYNNHSRARKDIQKAEFIQPARLRYDVHPTPIQLIMYAVDHFLDNSKMFHGNNATVMEDWNTLMQAIRSEASLINDKDPELAWLRAGKRAHLHRGIPMMVDTPDDLWNNAMLLGVELPPGPWRIAAIDADTFQVMEVEGQHHNTYDPFDEAAEERFNYNDCADNPIILRAQPSFHGV